MRRTAVLTAFVTCALWGACAGIAPPAGPAAAVTVPPTANATTWSLVNGASAPGAGNAFEAVSCTSSTFCMATGETGASSGTLIQRWDGTSWSAVANPPTLGGAVLTGISCVGASFCAAVGAVNDGVLIEQWNGATWSTATTPTPPSSTASQLLAVSCPSSTDCVAVGSVDSASPRVPLVEQWNGTSWTIVPSPAPVGSTSSELRGVSCSQAAFCVAVGFTESATLTSTLIEQWNGATWAIVPSPNESSASGSDSELKGVSCVGGSFCQAVGEENDGVNPQRTLIESWNGAAWSIVPSANASPTEFDGLDTVDCFSPTTCTAGGFTDVLPVGHFAPLTQVWDGSTWSFTPTPSGSASETSVVGVSCVTNWECVAVGGPDDSSGDLLVISAPIARSGYRFVASDGGIFSYGPGAPFLGSLGGTPLNAPIVGMAVMPGGDGYDLVASDGGVFNYGSAQFYGSAGAIHLNQPIVGMALTADGGGYWLVASDGGIFSYGDAQFYGSTGAIHLNKPIVGMAATPDGKGYWLVASDGGIFNYGDATFSGSAGSIALNKPVVGMAAPVSGGYYLVASDGGIFSYPTTNGPPFYGSTGSIVLNKPIVGMTAVAGGYYLSGSDGGVFAFPSTNGPPFYGSTGSIVLNKPIVGIAG
jgi:hypothetical protein